MRAANVDHLEDLRRAKDVLKDTQVIINLDRFVDILARRRVLSVIDEREIRGKKAYRDKIEAIFEVLLGERADDQYGHIIETLREMDRSDIIEKIQEP
ncbi:unnamed protein product [Darwinula stevensoni]|uniref:CARD domain-containing protein n=1 Tax=Darwinula stevensoni TaxID=69355 RepID=A0A7R8X5L7_9CRUS|nr:unnamed protein product [Darwinula stevensoni]CAG0880247.1 unnamed protein product [Darwinula stevensoni]